MGDENAYFESEDVFIATANPDALEDYIHPGSLAVTIRVLTDEKISSKQMLFLVAKEARVITGRPCCCIGAPDYNN